MGGLLFSAGRLKEAREFLEGGLALYDLSQHERYANRFGHDPVVTCLGYLSMTLWLLGYPDQAHKQGQKLCDLIPFMTHPSSQAYAYCHLAKQACLRRDALTAREYAEAAIHITRLRGLASWEALATAFKGWALCALGQMTEGWALLEESIQAWRARGLTHWSPFLLSLQAQAALKLQLLEAGINLAANGLEIGQNSGDWYWLAELHRLQGDLLRASGSNVGSVEAHFQLAIETARRQEARMLELRAALSLARMWQEQGRPQAAWEVLAPIYDWFTEGFETCDLQEAHKLLMKGVSDVSRRE